MPLNQRNLSVTSNIPFCEPDLRGNEAEYVAEAIASGWVGSKGDFIDRFEQRFARYIGVRHAITCSSGTSALMLAYHAMGMNGESVVRVPDNTFIATYNMARIFTTKVERHAVDPETWTLPLKDIKGAYGVAVHLYGNPCDMGDIYKHKFPLIEDCAQSLGSKFKGKMVGSYGIVSCFSFHSAKQLTTGEGGMVCTSNDEVAKRVRHLKNQAMTEPYQHTGMGYNCRMTNVQAAMGLAQLERIDEINQKKRDMTKFYNENLSKSFIRQKEQRSSAPVKWANAYRHPNASHIRRELADSGIETRPGFLGDDIIVLPCSTLLTKEQLEQVVTKANSLA